VTQQESVYSAILFLPAISRLKTAREARSTEWNRPARLAAGLVLLNAILQIGVVQVMGIYDHVAQLGETQKLIAPHEVADYGDHALSEHQRSGAKAVTDTHELFHRWWLLPNEKKELAAVYDISPLCTRKDGKLSCTPFSVQFVHDWKKLDTDGNGIWTIQEARADAAKLKTEHQGVSPETIFNNLINGLRFSRTFAESRGHNRTLHLAADVENEIAIPKAYFDFWIGDAMMCSFFDSSSCEAAAMDGVFEAALRPGRVSADAKGIHDLDSAIQYCYRMLAPGGGCEALLPTDFKRNREQRWGRCGTRSLTEGGKYTNPYNPDQSVHVLKATYVSVSALERATSRLYLLFLCLIIMLWFLALIDEVRELLKFGEFLITYPGIQQNTLGGYIIEKDGKETAYRITGLSKRHRFVLAVVYVLRLCVATTLFLIGTNFLLVQTDYLNLVLNSLALTFILDIDSILYTMMEKDTVAEMECCKKLAFRTRLPTDGILGYCMKKECWGLFLIPVVSVLTVLYFNYRDKEPVLEAMRCACIQEGSNCLDAMAFQASWWKNYWSHTLPAAMHHIEALRLAGN